MFTQYGPESSMLLLVEGLCCFLFLIRRQWKVVEFEGRHTQ